MPTTPEIQFAMKAINEASKVLRDIQQDIDNMADAADRGDVKMGDLAEKLGDIAEEAGKGASNVSSYGASLGGLADAGGNTERALTGVADITGFLGEQFGLSIGPIEQYSGALAQVGGGIEAALQGGPALLAQLKNVPATLAPVIAATWAHVAALGAQAAAFIAANAPIIILIASIALVAAGVVLMVQNWDTVKGTFIAAKDVLIDGANGALNFFRNNWPEIATLLSGPFAPIVLLATDAFGVRSALTGAGQAAIDWFAGTWPLVAGFVSGAFTGLVESAGDGFGVKSALTGAFDAALSYIGELGGTAWEKAQNLGSNLKDGLLSGLAAAPGLIGDLAAQTWSALKSVLNVGIDSINGLIPNSLSFSVLGKDIGIDLPDNPIPRLARGGIVNASTLALVGEAGPEAVVPLTKFDEVVRELKETNRHLAGIASDRLNPRYDPRFWNPNAPVPGAQWARTPQGLTPMMLPAEVWTGNADLEILATMASMGNQDAIKRLEAAQMVNAAPPASPGTWRPTSLYGSPPTANRSGGGTTINYYGPGDPHEFRRILSKAGVFD